MQRLFWFPLRDILAIEIGNLATLLWVGLWLHFKNTDFYIPSNILNTMVLNFTKIEVWISTFVRMTIERYMSSCISGDQLYKIDLNIDVIMDRREWTFIASQISLSFWKTAQFLENYSWYINHVIVTWYESKSKEKHHS